jgi:hypothetical protein
MPRRAGEVCVWCVCGFKRSSTLSLFVGQFTALCCDFFKFGRLHMP